MSALLDMLRTRSTPIKECIVFTAAHGHPTLGEDAAAELAAMQARIEKLEEAASKAVEWLHHYPSPEGIAQQTEVNIRRASRILEEVLKGE